MSSAGKDEKELTNTLSEQLGTSAVNAWYSEIGNYSYKTYGRKNSSKAIEHFTQLVWKKSVKLGVGVAKRKDGKTVGMFFNLSLLAYYLIYFLVLCRYYPRGNLNMSKNLPEQVAELK